MCALLGTLALVATTLTSPTAFLLLSFSFVSRVCTLGNPSASRHNLDETSATEKRVNFFFCKGVSERKMDSMTPNTVTNSRFFWLNPVSSANPEEVDLQLDPKFGISDKILATAVRDLKVDLFWKVKFPD